MASDADKGVVWLAVPHPCARDTRKQRYEMANWFVARVSIAPQICAETCGYLFETEDDAILFKLRFGGTVQRKHT